MEEVFEEQFDTLQASAREGGFEYGFGNDNDMWENVGVSPIDKLFIRLAELYLEVESSQQQALYAYCGRQPKYLENSFYFISRIGLLIHNKADKKWIDIGIAIAMLDGGRADFRDLINSLVLLRYIAEKQGIDARSIFNSYVQTTDGNMKGILENVRDRSKSSMEFTVQTFGPPEWKSSFWKTWNGFFKRK
jgi:hypothetical protein